MQAWAQAGRFDGLLIIPNAPFAPAALHVSSRVEGVTVESRPTGPWPQILIVLALSTNAAPTVLRDLFRPSGNSVEAEILYTRALYTVSETGSCFLASEVTSDDQVIGISFNFQPFPNEEVRGILYRAKIARKLKFIESVFNIRLTVPENITPDHVQYIETLFRGMTEGEFVSRGNGVTVFLKAEDANLSGAPFSVAGTIHTLSRYGTSFALPASIRCWTTSLMLKRAVLANQRLLS